MPFANVHLDAGILRSVDITAPAVLAATYQTWKIRGDA
jgi:hypothetical protein